MNKSAGLLVIAHFFNTFAKLGLFILLTQLGGFAVAGSYTLALAIVTPTFLLFGLSLRPIFVTFRGDVQYRHFLGLRFLYGLGGIIVIVLIGVLFQPEHLALLSAMAFYRLTELMVDIRIAYFQRHSSVSLMAMATFLFALLTTSVLAVVFVGSGNLAFSVLIAGMVGVLVFIAVSLIGPLNAPNHDASGNLLPSLRLVVDISRNGLMLSISFFAVSMGTSIPVLLLGAFHSANQVGIYSSIYNLLALGNILYSSITQAELKEFSNLASKGDFPAFLKRGRLLSWSMFALGVVGAIGLYFFGPSVFSSVFGQDFSSKLAPIMVMAATLCIAPFGFILDAQLTSLHRFSVQGGLSIITLGLTVIMGFLLVPGLGVLGGTLVVFITMLVRNLAKEVLVWRTAHKQVPARE